MKNLFEPAKNRKAVTGQLIWFLVWLSVTVIGAFVLKANPDGHGTHTQLGLPPCASVVFFDRPCPGCGLTTSWTHVLHGHFVESFRVHALGPIIYLGYTISALLSGFGYWKTLRFRVELTWISRLLIATLVVFITFGMIRFAAQVLDSPFYLPELVGKSI
ncbi:DUF2752 domain-containing protein [Kamptonema cortianum]|nr:DUF2752 domain-containing protein [Geitlerinema splendidum]MDK3160400.1 DUF2752 domain-containing protein [Kamptonema cortianum]